MPLFLAGARLLSLMQIMYKNEVCNATICRSIGASRPVEAIARIGQADQTNRVRRWSAERFSDTLAEVFRDFPQL